MNYIIYRRLKGLAICGDVNLPRGTALSLLGNFIYCDAGTLCAATSEQAHKYCARNDDGRGLERGALTYLIAYKPMGKGSRFDERQRNILVTKWERFLRPDCDYILFNHKFFNAPVEELEQLAKELELI